MTALLLAIVCQLNPISPDEIANLRRATEAKKELLMAAHEVRNWAWEMTAERFPIIAMPKTTPKPQRHHRGPVLHPYLESRLKCFYTFRDGGYRQLMKRYHVATAQELFAAFGSDEAGADNANLHRDPTRWTEVMMPRKANPLIHQGPRYFEPAAVRLSDKDAKWLNWVNPPPEKVRSTDPRELAGEG